MKTNIYTIEKIAPETWRLDECGRDNCYLLCGKTRALQSFADQGSRLTALFAGYTLFCGHGDGRMTHELLQKQITWGQEILARYPKNAEKHGKQYDPAFDPDGCVGYDPANLYPTEKKKGWTLESWNSILHG